MTASVAYSPTAGSFQQLRQSAGDDQWGRKQLQNRSAHTYDTCYQLYWQQLLALDHARALSDLRGLEPALVGYDLIQTSEGAWAAGPSARWRSRERQASPTCGRAEHLPHPPSSGVMHTKLVR